MSIEDQVAALGQAVSEGLALDAHAPWNALRPDAQAFDAIHIVTVPRYKESGLSGDEWRISAEVRFIRKGEVVHTDGCSNVETAAGMLYGMLMRAMDRGNAFFAGDGVHCDQESCPELATRRYRKLFDYCSSGHKSEPHRPNLRHFCERHKRRGDCGLDDADANYVEMPFGE